MLLTFVLFFSVLFFFDTTGFDYCGAYLMARIVNNILSNTKKKKKILVWKKAMNKMKSFSENCNKDSQRNRKERILSGHEYKFIFSILLEFERFVFVSFKTDQLSSANGSVIKNVFKTM